MPRRAGNDDPIAAPHDAYPCAGDDEWCAIAVETDAQWRALRRALGDPAWATAPTLDTRGRAPRAPRADRPRARARSPRRHEPRALMDAAAGRGRAGRHGAALERPHATTRSSRHRRFFRRSTHPEMGEVPYEGHQFRIAGYDNGPRSPAPCLGEHSIAGAAGDARLRRRGSRASRGKRRARLGGIAIGIEPFWSLAYRTSID